MARAAGLSAPLEVRVPEVVAWTVWSAALAAPVITTMLRVTRLDERMLLPIRLASCNDGTILAGGVPWLLLAGLDRLGVVDVQSRVPPTYLVVVAMAAAMAIAGSGFSLRHHVDATGAELQIASLNVERDTPAARDIGRQLAALDADVLVIQEYTPATAAALADAGLAGGFRAVRETTDEGWFGSALFSRHRVVSHEPVTIGDRPMTRSVLQVGGQTVTIVNVHLQAPIFRRDVQPWRRAFEDLAELVDATGGPLILVGDWNATLCHGPMRRLLRERRLIDAHSATSRWWPRTWPVGRRYPPFLCLDHLVVDRTVEVEGTNELVIEGTDHKVLLCAVRLP